MVLLHLSTFFKKQVVSTCHNISTGRPPFILDMGDVLEFITVPQDVLQPHLT